MTDKQILIWIKKNLGSIINQAIEEKREEMRKANKLLSPLISENVMAGICFREVGFLLHRFVAANTNFDAICGLMKGDYTKRDGETEKKYHGFSFWQLDVNSHLAFIKTGDWKNPLKACKKAIEALQSKIDFFNGNYSAEQLLRIGLASYNCGEGNVKKAIKKGYSISLMIDNKAELKKEVDEKKQFDIDFYTHNKDYSKEVLRFIEQYKSLSS